MDIGGLFVVFIIGFVVAMVIVGRTHQDVESPEYMLNAEDTVKVSYFDMHYKIVHMHSDDGEEHFIMDKRSRLLIGSIDDELGIHLFSKKNDPNTKVVPMQQQYRQ